jgi:HK97 family phage major capsid protein
MSRAFRLLQESESILEAAEAEGRALTEQEYQHHQELIAKAKAAGEHETALRDLTKSLGPAGGPLSANGGSSNMQFKSAGEQFTESAGYKAILRNRGKSWSSGLVDVGLNMKGTLLEGPGAPGTGTGGGLLGAPQVVPGAVQVLFRPLVFEDLLMSGQATTNTVRYAVEGTATSGAAGVAEGGVKPESTLAFSTLDEPIKKIATSITVSDELLEDAPAIQAFISGQLTFISGQLSLFVSLESERQLIRGTQGGNEVQGLLTSRSVPVYAGGTAVGNKAVQLLKAMNGMRGSAFLEPDWIAVHPGDYEDLRLLADSSGQLLGGGPWLGSYGNSSQVSSGGAGGFVDTLWGKPVYITPATGATKGTAIVGTTSSAQVWNRGGLSVEATNSHASNFVLNLSVIRAERRLGLTCHRPTGFVEVRLA